MRDCSASRLPKYYLTFYYYILNINYNISFLFSYEHIRYEDGAWNIKGLQLTSNIEKQRNFNSFLLLIKKKL